jgi:hypothetical protein
MSMLELQTMLKRGGASIVGERPPSDTTATERAEVALLRHIQALAKQHGWLGQHWYRADSDEEELECFLVRDVLLYAVVKTDTAKLTAKQLAWIEALRATGQIEVYVWQPSGLPAITARLTRKRGTHAGPS